MKSPVRFICAAAAAILLAGASTASCAVIRVKPTGSDANDGSSWALAKRTIQAAVNAAREGDEVWVARGTYYESIDVNKPMGLYGGFSGQETSREQSKPGVWTTTIDGQLRGRSVKLGAWSGRIVLDGFTIARGKAPEGGGVLVYGTCDVWITNNRLVDNVASYSGGGLYLMSSTVSLRVYGNVLVNNHASFNAGGIFTGEGAHASIKGNLFISNYAGRQGGASFAWASTDLTIANNTFVENSSLIGAGTFVYNAKARLTGNIFAFNTSAVRADGPQLPLADRNCFFGNGQNYDGLPPGPNDIHADPRFVAPWAGDYHLRPTSPCIDAGSNVGIEPGETDLDGKPRIHGARVDIGCFEYDGSPYRVREVTQARAFPHAFPVKLRDRVVTAAFPDGFYVQSLDRTAGMKVISGIPVQPGDLATAAGTLEVRDGELVLAAASASVAPGSEEWVPGPLSVRGPHLGGGPFFWQHNGEPCGQPAVGGGAGLNNVGLLVRVWGRVEEPAADGFILDDGSSARIRVVLPGGVSAPEAGQFVAVTGISSTQVEGGGILPAVRVRRQEDISRFLESGAAIAGRVSQQGILSIQQLVESPHPYDNDIDETWTVRGPAGTRRMRVHFAQVDVESGYDFLHIRDAAGLIRQTFSKGSPLFDVWSVWVPGDTVKLNLVTDSSITRFGFVMDRYEAEVEGAPLAGVVMTLEPGGRTVVTGEDGSYRFEGLAPGNYTVTPSFAGHTFSPSSRSVTLAGNQLADRVDFVGTAGQPASAGH